MGCACTPQHGRSADAAARGNRAKGGNGADNPGRLEDDYIVSAMIGKGHYGSVYKGICRRTGAVVAVKVIDKSKSRKKRLELEVNILRRIHRHPNVITLLDVYHTQDHVNLVLEMYVSGGVVVLHTVLFHACGGHTGVRVASCSTSSLTRGRSKSAKQLLCAGSLHLLCVTCTRGTWCTGI